MESTPKTPYRKMWKSKEGVKRAEKDKLTTNSREKLLETVKNSLQKGFIAEIDIIELLAPKETTEDFEDIVADILSLKSILGRIIIAISEESSLSKNRAFRTAYKQLIERYKGKEQLPTPKMLETYITLLLEPYKAVNEAEGQKGIEITVEDQIKPKHAYHSNNVNIYDILEVEKYINEVKSPSTLAKHIWDEYVSKLLTFELQNSKTELVRNYDALKILRALLESESMEEENLVTQLTRKYQENPAQLVQVLKNSVISKIENLKELEYLSKHLELEELKFYITFEYQNNKNEVIEQFKYILNNATNRLVKLSFIKPIIIIKKAKDGLLWYEEIDEQDNVVEIINKKLEECEEKLENMEVDLVIYGPVVESINLKVRYLCYVNNNTEEYTNKTMLLFPESLTSVALQNVTIENLNECLYVENIYSEDNTYEWSHISTLKHIKRIFSCDDTYIDNTKCLIEALLSYNKPIYVYINSGENTTRECILTKNIEELNFFQARGKNSADIKLDLEYLMPEKIKNMYRTFLKKKEDDSEFTVEEFIEEQNGNDNSNLISYLGESTYEKVEMELIFMKVHFSPEEDCYDFLYKLFEISNEYSEQEKEEPRLEAPLRKNTVDKEYDRIVKENLNQENNTQTTEFIQVYEETYNFLDHAFKEYIKTSADAIFKFNISTIEAHLLDMAPLTVINKFRTLDEESMREIESCLQKPEVQEQNECKIKCLLSEFIDCSIFTFQSGFSTIAVNDWTLAHIFDNIEDRIECIEATNRVIIIGTEEGTVYVYTGNEGDVFISEFIDEPTCDVVIIGYDCPNVGDLNIRSLNYINKGKLINVRLKYPSSLMSLSTEKMHIINFNECINLINLYSSGNTYNDAEITGLEKLRRIYSNEDRFSGIKYLIPTLLEVASLEYIHVIDDNPNLKPIEISRNIENLRYLYYYTKESRTYIELNIRENGARKLRLLQCGNDFKKYFDPVIIADNEVQEEQLFNQLIK